MDGMTPEARVIAEADGAVGRITFDNQTRRNAMTLAMWQGLWDAVEQFAADPAIRVIVLTGAGDKAFVAGADISEFEALRATKEGVARYNSIHEGADLALYHCPKPTIAMIRGSCVGGGMGIALACDLRVAAENARFGITAARLGLGYDATGIRKLVNTVGPEAAAEILYTGSIFDAEDARAMGILRHVVPVEDLAPVTDGIAGRIAEAAPLTVRASKAAIRAAQRRDDGADAEVDILVKACFDSADYQEGRRAFLEKRKPAFRGV
ncbi:MAG: enoyl-CoA hydratase [Pseudomonadota bacterium]